MPGKLTLRSVMLSLVAFVLITFSASAAKADQVTVFGNTYGTNLQATINITSLSAGSITFSVTNVLVAGVTSTITGIGFEFPGVVVTANSPGACSGNCNNFTATPTVDNAPGNVPQFDSAVLDWAVTTGPGFAGGNPPGINQGQVATFTVTGDFTGLTQANFLAGVYVRFQSVNIPGVVQGGSDVAHDTAVPEPASMLLLGSGLVGLGAGIRRWRHGKKE